MTPVTPVTPAGPVATNGPTATVTTPTSRPVSSNKPGSSRPGSAKPTASAAPACTGMRASGPGVTATSVKVVTTNLSLAGPIGNSAFNVRSDLTKIAQALADDINAKGGVACGRKIVLKQYDVNPLDANDQKTKCLQIQQDAPLIVIDFGGYLTTTARKCFADAKIPMTEATPFGTDELKTSYPYVFGMRNVAEQAVHQGIIGLNARGFFTIPAVAKVGLFEDSCAPSVNKQIESDLNQIGIPSNKLSTFTLGCDIAAQPNQILQAVLQHKGDRVSHVFLATSNTNEQNYVKLADAQGFHPRYGMSDYGESMTQSGAGNWVKSFDGAVGITSSHMGEFASGQSNPDLKECDATMKRHGVPGFSSEAKDTAVAGYCDMFKFFAAIMDKGGPNPTRESMAVTVSTLGAFVDGYIGDGVFNRPGKITGGDFQRELQYHADCGCWKIVDKTMAPDYA